MGLIEVLRFISSHPLNRGRRAAAIARFLRWQFGSRLLPYPVAFPFVDETRMFVERGMTGATGNYYCGLHEAEDMAFVLHLLRPGDCFYDIGANVGSYSLLAAAAGVENIVAFEPSAQTADRLLRNAALNALDGRLALHRVALGSVDGEAAFSRGGDTTNHVLAEGEAAESETVQIRRLDEFYAPGRPSFLKLDVEGFESQALAGAGMALGDPSLMGVLVEDNGYGRRYGGENTVSAVLTASGFAPFDYDPWKRRLDPATGASRTGNRIFLRDAAGAQLRVGAARKFKLINGWI